VTRRPLVTAAVLATAFAAVVAWGVLVGPGQIAVRDHRLVVTRWPAALDGVRIAALADVHEGAPFVTRDRVRTLVSQVNAREPDLVVLLGDYVIHGVVGGTFHAPEEVSSNLSGLRGRHGVFAVQGNHDVWLDSRRVRRAFEAEGITFLEDESRIVTIRGVKVRIVGLREFNKQGVDLQAAFAGGPADATTLVLTHSPDIFPMLPDDATLTLAGHTHGGQVRLPLLGTPVVPSAFGSRYVNGFVEEGVRDLFVSPGIGTSILPIRLGVPPEVSLLEIRHR
jgi:uncharacterized protein